MRIRHHASTWRSVGGSDVALALQIEIPELAEECHLVELDPEQESRRRRQHAGPAYDEDDDHPGMNRVQCATS